MKLKKFEFKLKFFCMDFNGRNGYPKKKFGLISFDNLETKSI